MKTTIITFALLVATLVTANAATNNSTTAFAHRKNARISHEGNGFNGREAHAPKKRNNNIVRDDVMWNRF